MVFNPARKAIANSSPQGGAAFNPMSAGKKHYGAGRSMPNIGKNGYTPGYGQRDAEAAARKNALLRRIQGS